MLKISREGNLFKINFVGIRYSIKVKEGEILQVVAHYYLLPSHSKDTNCPVCEKIGHKVHSRYDFE